MSIRNISVVLAAVSLLGAASIAQATPNKMHGKTSCIECHSLTKAESDNMLKAFRAKTTSIKNHPAGLFEVMVEADGRKGIFFIPYGKKTIFVGQAIDPKEMKPVFMHANQMPKNVPQKALEKIDIKQAPVKDAVTIGNPAGKKHLYVFTDPDCPYCRQLHPVLHKMAQIDKDVAVHIMLMPIPQLHPKAYDKSRAVIATKDIKMLDDAFGGKPVEAPKADAGKKEVDGIMQFAQKAGINGTPFVFLGDGSVYSGPRTAEEMVKALK